MIIGRINERGYAWSVGSVVEYFPKETPKREGNFHEIIFFTM